MSIESLLGIGGEIACTLDASAQVGDLVAFHNGIGYPIKRLGDFEPPSSSYAYSGVATVELTNGDVAVIYPNLGHAISFVIYDATLATVKVAQTAIATGGLGSLPSAIALSGGGFCVAWRNPNTQYPSFAIFSNAGSVVKAATELKATGCYGRDNPVDITIAQLSGGNIAFGWENGADNYPYYAVISSAGNTVKAATLVVASAISGHAVKVAASGSGNTFAVAFIPGTTFWIYAYDSAGTQTGFIEGFSPDNYVAGFDFAATNDGRYVVAASYGGTNFVGIRWFNSLAQVISYQWTTITTKPTKVALAIDSNNRAYAVGTNDAEYACYWGAETHTDGNYRWIGSGVIQLGIKYFPRGSISFTREQPYFVRNPHGGAVAAIGYGAGLNGLKGQNILLIKFGTSASGSLLLGDVMDFRVVNGDDSYTRIGKPIVTKAITAFGYGWQGPRVFVTNTAPIAGCATSSTTIKQGGKHSITNGVLPAGRSLKSFPLLGGTIIDGACISATDIILGS